MFLRKSILLMAVLATLTPFLASAVAMTTAPKATSQYTINTNKPLSNVGIHPINIDYLK
ncbi:hypothetical protein AB4238_09400 [Shewanella sp. 10N.286.45.A1]|uniref:hypothetical protein n=1 Tax=Shewanella sp. 10N.286.45.A1 TaxID=3229694 RepID=UPI00354E4680